MFYPLQNKILIFCLIGLFPFIGGFLSGRASCFYTSKDAFSLLFGLLTTFASIVIPSFLIPYLIERENHKRTPYKRLYLYNKIVITFNEFLIFWGAVAKAFSESQPLAKNKISETLEGIFDETEFTEIIEYLNVNSQEGIPDSILKSNKIKDWEDWFKQLGFKLASEIAVLIPECFAQESCFWTAAEHLTHIKDTFAYKMAGIQTCDENPFWETKPKTKRPNAKYLRPETIIQFSESDISSVHKLYKWCESMLKDFEKTMPSDLIRRLNTHSKASPNSTPKNAKFVYKR